MSKGKEKRRKEVYEREKGWAKGPRGLRSHLLLKLQVEFSPTTDTDQDLPTCTTASDLSHHFSVFSSLEMGMRAVRTPGYLESLNKLLHTEFFSYCLSETKQSITLAVIFTILVTARMDPLGHRSLHLVARRSRLVLGRLSLQLRGKSTLSCALNRLLLCILECVVYRVWLHMLYSSFLGTACKRVQTQGPEHLVSTLLSEIKEMFRLSKVSR